MNNDESQPGDTSSEGIYGNACPAIIRKCGGIRLRKR